MAVYTTLQQTKQVVSETVQAGLDLVAQQNYLTEANLDTELSESTVIQNLETAVDSKVSATVDRKTLILG